MIDERECADLYRRSVVQGRGVHDSAIDPGAIERTQVFNDRTRGLEQNLGMRARYRHVVKEDAVLRIATNGGLVVGKLKGVARLWPLDDRENRIGD